MEEVGRQMGCTYIRLYLYTIHNEKLERVLPRFGYTTSGPIGSETETEPTVKA